MTISALFSTWSSPFLNGTQNLNSSGSSVPSSNTTFRKNSSSDSVSISSAAYDALGASMTKATNYQQLMTEKARGQEFLRSRALSDPTSPETAKFAYDLAHPNLTANKTGGLIDISGSVPGGPVKYTSGEPVTAESQAYYTQKAALYQDSVSKLYDSAIEKGETPGQIVSQIFDLQAQQPAMFREMNMWPSAGTTTS